MSDSASDRSQTSGGPWFGRRNFLIGSLASVPVATILANNQNASHGDVGSTPKTFELTLTINGQKKSLKIDPRTTLLDLLRENLSLTGTKKGCDHGACGACTVHVNGERVLSCLTLAATLKESDVKTIEGLTVGESLHPLQETFIQCDAFQCGYCTPGQIMSGVACIKEGHATGSLDETREWMSGNLCRCSAYPNIVEAVRKAAEILS